MTGDVAELSRSIPIFCRIIRRSVSSGFTGAPQANAAADPGKVVHIGSAVQHVLQLASST